MQTHSSFAVFINLRTLRQKEAFQHQVREFAIFINRKVERLQKPLPDGTVPVPSPAAGADICRDAFYRFHLRCRLLEVVADWMSLERVEPRHGLKIIRHAVLTLCTLVGPDTEEHRVVLRSAYDWLNRSHRWFPSLLVVVYCPYGIDLAAHDDLAWTILMEGNQPVFTWDMRKLVLGGGDEPINRSYRTESAPLRLSVSQAKALDELHLFYELQNRRATAAGIRLRPYPLLVGSSGCGKSALVRHFAVEESIALLELNCGAWVVTGARVEPHTLVVLLNFIRKEPGGVIFIDGIDKFVARSDWNSAVQQEVYSLLDGRLSGVPEWTAGDAGKLKTSFLIVGAGTWQHLYKAQTRSLGFGEGASMASVQGEIERESVIPEELLFRFNANLIEIEPMSSVELGERIRAIREELGLPTLESPALERLVREAVESRKNMRWLEAYLFTLLRTSRAGRRPGVRNPERDLPEEPFQTQAA